MDTINMNVIITVGAISIIMLVGFACTAMMIKKMYWLQRMENLANQIFNDLCNPQVKQSTYQIEDITLKIIKSTPNEQSIRIGEYRFSVRYGNDQIEVVVWGKETIFYQRCIDLVA